MAFRELQSEEHGHFLDIVDRLRSKGMSKNVDLPEIIVCGGRSAGKSSVLEAISGISFLTDDNASTRKRRSGSFTVPVSVDKPDIETIIGEAKEAMGLSEDKMFSTDILRVELCGPTQPHLTVIDLPGLCREDNQEPPAEDAEVVQQLVLGYLKRPRSLILAVVSAESLSYLEVITEVLQEHDPKGARTLGIITKPDYLEEGSDREAAYIDLAKNRDVSLQLGWHVLKNRHGNVQGDTSIERNDDEESFFSRGAWATIDPNILGIKSLMPKLSNILKNQILQQVPSLIRDVDDEMETCKAQLKRLGKPRTTLLDQRKYLLQVSREFAILMKAAVDGDYKDAFFGSAKSAEGYRRRLRARIQNMLADFDKDMRVSGQSCVIIDDSAAPDGMLQRGQEWRSVYVDEVIDFMKRSRTRGLPGTFNPLIIGELLIEQCQPWKTISAGVEKELFHIVDDVAQAIVEHVAVDETRQGILYLINEEISGLKSDLNAKIQEVLRPYSHGHPITYNVRWIDMVQKEQEKRRHDELERKFKELVGLSNFQQGHYVSVSPLDVLSLLKNGGKVDLEHSSAEAAIDYMLAYYKLALDKFVDDMSILAVEQCLVAKLPALLPTERVMDLQDHDVSYFVKEGFTAPAERHRCTEKLMVLERERQVLTRLDTRRSLTFVAEAAQRTWQGATIPRSYTTGSTTPDESKPWYSGSSLGDRRSASPAAGVENELPSSPAVRNYDLIIGSDPGTISLKNEPTVPEPEPEPKREPEPEPEATKEPLPESTPKVKELDSWDAFWHGKKSKKKKNSKRNSTVDKPVEAPPEPDLLTETEEIPKMTEEDLITAPVAEVAEEPAPEAAADEQGPDAYEGMWGSNGQSKKQPREKMISTWPEALSELQPCLESEGDPAPAALSGADSEVDIQPKHSFPMSSRGRKKGKKNRSRVIWDEPAAEPEASPEIPIEPEATPEAAAEVECEPATDAWGWRQ
ncbi:hypothetical protein ED733_000484 [Metarhizium rileyi]|uniref:Interferon-induced GTP-binding protein Mx n=1 Tax=Metarhizium rileyi (strain RCEF 4871) TaxID=1649241 RepID=A0A5C6G548_METRR|nr:hypothetical protein ED733_000484 [Metarhizium rileyi]